MPLVSIYDDMGSALTFFIFKTILRNRELKLFMTTESCLIMMIKVRQWR